MFDIESTIGRRAWIAPCAFMIFGASELQTALHLVVGSHFILSDRLSYPQALR